MLGRYILQQKSRKKGTKHFLRLTLPKTKGCHGNHILPGKKLLQEKTPDKIFGKVKKFQGNTTNSFGVTYISM